MPALKGEPYCMGPFCDYWKNSDELCNGTGVDDCCSKELKEKERERIKYWCPSHGYPVPCAKCGYQGTEYN